VRGFGGASDIRASFSKDYVIGFDRQITNFLDGRLEVYYRNLFGLAGSFNPQGQGPGIGNGSPGQGPASGSAVIRPIFGNYGSGRAYGTELTFDLARIGGWSGNLAVEWSRSFRTSGNGVETPYDYDQPWVVTLLLEAPTAWDWRPSAQIRYSNGRPYTPVTGTNENSDGTISPVRGDQNSARYPDGYLLSARIARPLRLFGMDDLFYFEVTDDHEVLNVDYGTDFENYDNPTFNYGIAAIPYIGYQVRF
jgi:hypothetical protein